MEPNATYWPEKPDRAFDVVLIEAIGDHVGQVPTDLPPLYDTVDLEAVKRVVCAETWLTLTFDIDIPGVGWGVDGKPATSVTVMLETKADDAVHITVTDEGQDPGGVGTAPQLR